MVSYLITGTIYHNHKLHKCNGIQTMGSVSSITHVASLVCMPYYSLKTIGQRRSGFGVKIQKKSKKIHGRSQQLKSQRTMTVFRYTICYVIPNRTELQHAVVYEDNYISRTSHLLSMIMTFACKHRHSNSL